MAAPRESASLKEVLVHRQLSLESLSSQGDQDKQHGTTSHGRSGGGRKPPLLPTIQSSESLRGMDNQGFSGSSVPQSQLRPALGIRVTSGLRQSSHESGDCSAADRDPSQDVSQGSATTRITHSDSEEEEQPSRSWAHPFAHKRIARFEDTQPQQKDKPDHHKLVFRHLRRDCDANDDVDDALANVKRKHRRRPSESKHRRSGSNTGDEAAAKKSTKDDSSSSDATSDDRRLEGFDSEEDNWDDPGPPLKRAFTRRWKWHIAAIIVSAVIFLSGIAIRVVYPQEYVEGNVTAWRWVMLVGLLVPAYWVGEGLAQGLEAAIEWNFFENRRVLYYFIGTTKPLGRMFKTALLPVLWATIFSDESHSSEGWETAYNWILRLLLCLFLINVAFFVTTMLAKFLASYFHKQAFFDKMQETLQQEHYLWALSRPKETMRSLTESDGDETATLNKAETSNKIESSEGRQSRSSLEAHVSTMIPPPAVPATKAQSRLLPLQVTKSSFSDSNPRSPYDLNAIGGPPLSHRYTLPTSPKATPFADSRPLPGTSSKREGSSRRSSGGVSGRTSARLTTGLHSTAASNEPVTKHAAAAYRRRVAAVLQSVRDEDASPRRSQGQGQEEMMEEAILRNPDLASTKFQARMEKIENRIRNQEFGATFDHQLGAAKQLKNEDRDREAKRLAFYIFWNVKRDFARNYVVQSDLKPFLSKAKAKAAFSYLDANDSGRVGQSELLASVIQIFKDRRNLALALKGTRSVIGTLQAVIGIIVHIVFFFFYLLVLRISVDNMWITVSSGLLGFSFIFGNSIRGVFESILTLFVVHPFDVGDTLVIKGDYCVVEEASLTKIVVTRWDGARMWYPNELLNTNTITNVSRTDSQCQWFKVLVDVSTPASACAHVREVLRVWVNERPADLKPDPAVGFWAPSADPMKVYLAVYFDWNFNAFEDRGRAGPIRHQMYLLISDTLTELKVQYTLPSFAQPSAASDANLPRGSALGQLSLLHPTPLSTKAV